MIIGMQDTDFLGGYIAWFYCIMSYLPDPTKKTVVFAD